MEHVDKGGPRQPAAWALGIGAAIAMCAALLSTTAAGGAGSTSAPVTSTDIEAGISSLRPNCMMIARHRLRSRLDRDVRTVLTRKDVDAVLSPLRRGGSDLCDAITDQSFALGGS